MKDFAELIDGYRRFRTRGWAQQRERWDELRDGQSPKGTLSDKRRMLALGFEPSMVEHYSGYQIKWRNPKWEIAFYVPARTIMLTERATAKTVKGQLLAPLLNIVETHL